MDSAFEDAPLKAEAGYRLLFERNPFPVWVYDTQTLRTLAANAAALTKYGYNQHELVKLTVLDLHHTDDTQALKALLDRPVAGQDANREWQHRHRDGTVFDVEMDCEEFMYNGVQARMLLIRDISEQRHAESSLLEERKTLSELTQRLISHEKTIVNRLAQVLHDQLGQTIAAIRMAHETIVTLQQDAPTPVTRLQTQMGTLISQAVRQVRRVLVDLHPPLLDEHGLAAALENELRNQSLARPAVDISVHVQPEITLMRWPSEVEYASFMVAREAVENALRHSGASSVSVRLTGTAAALQLEVLDNGLGFAADATPRVGHLGLLDMRERAHAVGATLCVDAGTPHGTSVRLNWKATP